MSRVERSKTSLDRVEKSDFVSLIAVEVESGGVTSEPVGLAYDVAFDIQRYEELRWIYGGREAKKLLVEEMSVDLLTHFGELGGESGRVSYFSYSYLINEDGELVEDAQARKLIREMYEGQKDVVADLWRNWMIPFFEESTVGSSAFTLSAKRDGDYEGDYDYAYYFKKMNKKEVVCFGLELDLSKEEQAAILNRQYEENEQYWMLLDESPNSDEVRGRALFYPPGYFASSTQAYARIIGQVLEEIRGDYHLNEEDKIEDHFEREKKKLDRKKDWVNELAKDMVDGIVVGRSAGRLQNSLSEFQMRELVAFDPYILENAQNNNMNEVVLPCGKVVIDSSSKNGVDFDLRSAAGENVVEGNVSKSEDDGKCVKCPFCKKTVDAIVTASKIKCPECKTEVDK